jgi:cell division protein FtsI (penicillin-binding protein 3)
LRPLTTQLPEVAAPLWPRHWVRINAMTIAFGHGISVTPLHLATGSAAIVNGGMLYQPSFIKRTGPPEGKRVVKLQTSQQMRQLLRLNVIQGTGKNSEVKGYEVGGKTGTAEKPSRGGYRQKALISSFVGMFPMSEPRFLILVSLDEPKGIAETGGYATGGMVSAPSVRSIIESIVSLYGIQPGEWTGNPSSLEVSSMPVVTAPPAPHFTPVSARGRGPEPRRAMPLRTAAGQTVAAPGARPNAAE